MPTGALIGGSVASAGASLLGANEAAGAQERAAQQAAQTQLAMYSRTRSDLAPYRTIGAYGGKLLTNRLTELTSPITMDEAHLMRTPGYRFTLGQGLKATQSAAAARGLGLSGAAIKAATDYATGKADQTYQDQFNLENINRSNAFNRLLQVTGVGGNAAAQTGQAGLTTGQGVASAQLGAGQAQAASYMAGANAIGSGINNAAQTYGLMPIYNKLLGAGGGGYWGGSTQIDPLTRQPIS